MHPQHRHQPQYTTGSYLRQLISGGESQHLDFKFHVSSMSKIAKSLVAFANTEGGRLLIGVKDNGAIVGIESEEEIYMLQSAAEDYCRPQVNMELTVHEHDGKTVLEAHVKPSAEKPHYAKDESGKWLVYIRKDDENLLANKVLVEVFKRKKKNKETIVRYAEPERLLLGYLSSHKTITFREFMQLAAIPPRLAERILINLVSLGIVNIHLGSGVSYYTLAPQPSA